AAGAGAPMSATISPGLVVPSSWGVIDTFSSGTFTNTISSISIPGSLTISQVSSDTFINAGGESSSLSLNWTNILNQGFGISWQNVASGGFGYGNRFWQSASADNQCTDNPGDPGNSAAVRFQVLDISSSVLSSFDTKIITHTQPLQQFIVPTSTITQQMIQIRVTYRPDGTAACGRFNSNMWSVPFIRPQYLAIKIGGSGSLGNCQALWDIDEGTFTLNGAYSSPVFNTGFSTPTWGNFLPTLSSSTIGSLKFQPSVSTSASGVFDSSATATPGAQIISAQKQYIDYFSRWSVPSSTVTPAVLTNTNLSAATTGLFISQCFHPGTPNLGWGAFQANTFPNGGTLTFFVSTGATCGSVQDPNANWVLQPNNALITIDTAPFLGVKTQFFLDNASKNPALQALQITLKNSAGRPATASTVYNRRYYLAYSSNTSPTAFNDHVLVY